MPLRVVRDVFFRKSQKTSKVCLDCAGAYGLHVRPPRVRGVLPIVQYFSGTISKVRVFIDFESILVSFWEGFEYNFSHIWGQSSRSFSGVCFLANVTCQETSFGGPGLARETLAKAKVPS